MYRLERGTRRGSVNGVQGAPEKAGAMPPA